jgi:hypothetical protein
MWRVAVCVNKQPHPYTARHTIGQKTIHVVTRLACVPRPVSAYVRQARKLIGSARSCSGIAIALANGLRTP